jgi:4-alpha-glucanotransferase
MHPEYFQLDENRAMKYVAGVPPDYFSATGQLWGNPVYDWGALKATGFSWWLERLRHTLGLVDKVLIDHFRGLVQFWRVPVGAKTAMPEEGARWMDGPGETFFAAIRSAFPGALIGEDLGIITQDVVDTMQRFGIPGLKVLQFAFGDEQFRESPHLPENHVAQSVVHTGTHDNDATVGWLQELRQDKNPSPWTNLMTYLKQHGMGASMSWRHLAWEVITLAMGSVSDTAILPMQDVLGLGRGRMNKPATQGNWRWRMWPGAINTVVQDRLLALTKETGRMRP